MGVILGIKLIASLNMSNSMHKCAYFISVYKITMSVDP